MGSPRYRPGYLASLLARIRVKETRTGMSFSKATWSVCFFEECDRNTVAARDLERRILQHQKRSMRVRVVKFSARPKKGWEQTLSTMLGRSFEYLQFDARNHQLRHCSIEEE